MDELKWELLTELQGKWNADMLKSYLEAYGIEVLVFQESLGQHIYPTQLDILGRVQVFAPKKEAKVARKLLEEYNSPPEPQKAKRGPGAGRTATGKSRSKPLDSKKTTKSKMTTSRTPKKESK